MRFFSLLKEIRSPHNSLYILGDFFDQWVRDSINIQENQEVINQLKKATDLGLIIYLQNGNRDFMYGKKFKQATGIHYITDPHVITLDQKRVTLMHGDSLCTDDLSYQKFRRLIQHPFSKLILRSIPKAWLIKFTQGLRKKSTQTKATKKQEIMDVNSLAVTQALKTCDILIHGHTHRPFVHKNSRYVLGDWEHDCQIVVYEKQKLVLKKYP